MFEFSYVEFTYYMMGEFFLQPGASISKWETLFQSGASVITKWCKRYYKVVQALLQSSASVITK